MSSNKVELGDRVKDNISGYKGIATGHLKYINGCERISITPEELDKDGKPKEAMWFDIEQISVMKKNIQPVKSPRSGPMNDPVRSFSKI